MYGPSICLRKVTHDCSGQLGSARMKFVIKSFKDDAVASFIDSLNSFSKSGIRTVSDDGPIDIAACLQKLPKKGRVSDEFSSIDMRDDINIKNCCLKLTWKIIFSI